MDRSEEPGPDSFIFIAENGKLGVMTDLHEREIADQIDREVASSDGLVALVLCLSMAVGLVVASGFALLNAL